MLDALGRIGWTLKRRRGSHRTLQAVAGRIVPELRAVGVFVYRELVEGPWRIVYRFDADRIHVTAVLDARRNLSSLLLERLVH